MAASLAEDMAGGRSAAKGRHAAAARPLPLWAAGAAHGARQRINGPLTPPRPPLPQAEEGLRGRTVTLKLKAATFELRTRAATLDRHVSSTEDLAAAGLRLLHAELPLQVRLLGLRVSNFQESRRDPGQPSLEQLLARQQSRVTAAQQQQQQQQRRGEAGSGEQREGQQREQEEQGVPPGVAAVHCSQVLSAAEMVELTLHEWAGEAEGAGGAGAAAPAGSSLPPSLAVSPATAQRYDQEAATAAAVAAAGPGVEGLPAPAASVMHLPPTALDIALRRAAEQQQQQEQGSGDSCGSERQPERTHAQAQPERGGPLPPSLPEQGPSHLWACEACTFLNSKLYSSCEMCLQARARPEGSTGQSSKRQGGRKRKSSAATGSAGSKSILTFLSRQQQQTPPLLQQRQQDVPRQQDHHQQQLMQQQRQQGQGEPSSPPYKHQHQQEPTSPPEAPLHPGEDLIECPTCGVWVRETRAQAHADGHLAEQLQKEEDRWALLGSGATARGRQHQQHRGGGGTITALIKRKGAGGNV